MTQILKLITELISLKALSREKKRGVMFIALISEDQLQGSFHRGCRNSTAFIAFSVAAQELLAWRPAAQPCSYRAAAIPFLVGSLIPFTLLGTISSLFLENESTIRSAICIHCLS